MQPHKPTLENEDIPAVLQWVEIKTIPGIYWGFSSVLHSISENHTNKTELVFFSTFISKTEQFNCFLFSVSILIWFYN